MHILYNWTVSVSEARVCPLQPKLRLLRLFFCRILSDYISMIALKLYKASHSALSSLAGWTDNVSTIEPLGSNSVEKKGESYEATR